LEVFVNKFTKSILGLFLAVFLLGAAFSGGYVVGHTNQYSILDQYIPFLRTSNTPFWEAWSLVHNRYVDQPVDDTLLMRGAINGMLASLGDPHTSYFDPVNAKKLSDKLKGQQDYEGIGAYVLTNEKYLKVLSPIPGSNAEKAGILPGDFFIAIDGKDMTGIDPVVARESVIGPAGTTVTLTIRREGVAAPFDVKVVRAKITIPSVESKMLDNGVGYISLNVFGKTSSAELKTALTGLLAQKPKGIILDLRNNTGGLLQSAVEVSSLFIKDGLIVTEKYGDGTPPTALNAIPGGIATDIPMVVLVNELSASASEIVAGALQDYGRAKLVGVTTYGKGSVQVVSPLSNNQGEVKVTIAKWFTPKGRTIDKAGLTPDVVVTLTKEDFTKGLDPQMDAAVKTLLDMIK
jgi:carboxyl-terminal processing protease